ncbi:hypothetical protein HAX54_016719 [Datura stramonium]|uniref:Amidase domain-containing protein n=1 Tax=Datura stramonium TaxID=4076 RepID=A0ABS8UJK4_DATST|nr:hypothetical protein [Datura stramonium]
MAIKDDIDCYPHPSKGASTWMHEVCGGKEGCCFVSKLMKLWCTLAEKQTCMSWVWALLEITQTMGLHEIHMIQIGTQEGLPQALQLCLWIVSHALGRMGGGQVQFGFLLPLWCCGLKSTYGRTDMTGHYDDGTVAVIGPIALNSNHLSDSVLRHKMAFMLSTWICILCSGLMMSSTDISDKCGNVLNRLSEKHGCKTVEIVIPDLHEMRIAHAVSIGSEALCSMNPDCSDGKGERLTYDTRTNLALFRSFTAADYVAAQRLRRRLMYFHMEIFKKVDIIVTPTTGMTAPRIPPSALKFGETDLQVTGNLMRFIITANLLGLPAVTVPVGYDKQGLPIGMQLIGRPWCEASICATAAIEETCAEPKKKPLQY